ncbi:MAG: ABC transporter ATP-binding protein [Clostridia bacterium]|nr:ABC transporter ATP-binding protein [Clostridia bacterium]
MIRLLKRLKEIKGTAILSTLFAILAQAGGLVLPLLMSDIINNGIMNGDVDYIKRMGIIMMLISAVSVVISIFNSFFSSKTASLFSKSLRKSLFVKVETLAKGDIEKIGTPSLITRCTNDVRIVQDFVLQGLRMIISAPIMLVGGVIMTFILNARLALIIFALIPLIAIIAGVVIKTVIPMFRKRQKMLDGINRFIREKLSGIRVIRAFNKQEFEDAKFEVKNMDFSALTLKFNRIMSVLIPIATLLLICGLELLVMLSAKNLDTLDVVTQRTELISAIGDLQAFITYMLMIIFAVVMAAAMFVIIPRARISALRICEVLDLTASVTDPEAPETADDSKKGTVEFRNVTFAYENAAVPVLSDISFTAEKGKVTAIIGGTGSGKSSLIAMVPRFFDVTDGQILFDGTDVRNYTQEDLRSRIGFVPQKACLFSGSIEDNLRFGDENATEEQMRKALDISCSSEFVNKLSDGMQSFISQNANNLSGGQKQRLSIARALTRKAEVYIFDDSFSALDFATDAAVRANIRKHIDATIIIVAQRIGTILDADKIVVLDQGKTVGIGRHEELMESCEQYRQIYISQMGGAE